MIDNVNEEKKEKKTHRHFQCTPGKYANISHSIWFNSWIFPLSKLNIFGKCCLKKDTIYITWIHKYVMVVLSLALRCYFTTIRFILRAWTIADFWRNFLFSFCISFYWNKVDLNVYFTREMNCLIPSNILLDYINDMQLRLDICNFTTHFVVVVAKKAKRFANPDRNDLYK